MRYAKDQKEQSRSHILRVAGQRFRRDGADTVGIAALMADAGLTHGGFYNHFASRDELVAEAFAVSLDETLRWLEETVQRRGGTLEALVDTYLSPKHIERWAEGCALAALCSEVARRPAELREPAAAQIKRYSALVRRTLPNGVPHPDNVARAILAMMVGALQLARLSADKAETKAILASAKQSCLDLAGNP